MPTFPNVPNVPGVPALLRDVNAILSDPVLLFTDLVSSLFGGVLPQWGVYLDGVPVIAADNVVAVGGRKEWGVSDYPVEPNAFESYNKVETPAEFTVRMTAGGTLARREQFLQSVEAAAATNDLYDVVMPERAYASMNITRYDFRRTAQGGLGLMIVDLRLIEVRVTASSAFTDTKSPSSAGQQNNGIVNGSAPTTEQQTVIDQQLGPE